MTTEAPESITHILLRLDERLTDIGGCGATICAVTETAGHWAAISCQCTTDPLKMAATVEAYRDFAADVMLLACQGEAC